MNRFFYGWIIVALGFFSMAFWQGTTGTYSVFYVVLIDEFSWQRAESAGAMAISQIVYTLSAPFIGGLIHRYGPRKVVVPGILILIIGLALCSRIESLGQFYLYYGLPVGYGVTCISMVSFAVIISRWFDAQRGLAIGIASAGTGMGLFVLVPFTQKMISSFGWNNAYLVLAGLVAIFLLPTNLIFLKHRPQDMGLLPDGKAKLRDNAQAPDKTDILSDQPHQPQWTISRLSRSVSFYAMVTFPALSIFSVMIVIVHNMRFFVDQGVDRMDAASAFAFVGLVSMIFRVIWGWFTDRVGREITYTIGMVALSMGIACLVLLEKTGHPAYLVLFSILFGMGWGSNAPVFVASAADLFKGPLFGLIYGFVESIIGVAAAFGAWVGGYIYDHTQSYMVAFELAIASALLSAALIWVAAPRKAQRTP
jgi:MFS family permease